MKNIFAVIASILVVSTVSAQKVRFDIKFTGEASDVKKVYVQPCGDSNTVTLRVKGESYVGTTPYAESGFYNIIALKGHSQVILPIYIGEDKNPVLQVNANSNEFVLNNTPENRALSALAHRVNDLDRRLWLKGDMTGKELKELIEGYRNVLDSIIVADGVTGKVADYMKVYTYSRAYNAYSNIPRTQSIPATSIPFSKSDVLPSVSEAFDNEYSPMFYTAMHIIRDNLTASPVMLDKLESLYETYKNEAVRQRVVSIVVGDYITNYNYTHDFEGGLELLKRVTEQYGLSDEYVKDFAKRKAIIPGSAFPEGITLVDANGKKVDFSDFKGKYVYIDMWASWCGPCCKEVPHLQKLEAELQNKDVVFVSISCDSDEQAWKNKIAEIGMHGIQLIDKENALGDALNIKGIPFYLIYDKQGNLHTYNAKRPSSGEAIKEILEGLK